MTNFTEYQFIGDGKDLKDRANQIDKEILSKRNSQIYTNSVFITGIISIFTYAIGNMYNINNIECMAVIVMLAVFLLAQGIQQCYHKMHPYNFLLKERHKRLQNKDEEKYIVYLNLLYVLTKDAIINLDNNMFKVRGSNGNWKFKEIKIKDISTGNKLIIDIENLVCWSKESKMG